MTGACASQPQHCLALRQSRPGSHACADRVHQLISAMAALAEFDAEVEKLFAYHDLEEGKYTVRLFDLPSQQWKEVCTG